MTILQGRVTSGRRQFSSKILLALAAVLGTFCLLELSACVWLTRIADDEAFVRYASIPQLERRFGEGLLDLAAQRGKTPYSPHRYLGYCPTPGYERGPNRHNSGKRVPDVSSLVVAGPFEHSTLLRTLAWYRDHRLDPADPHAVSCFVIDTGSKPRYAVSSIGG